ncbi:MAG: hypothetical protein F4Y38_06500 [Gemmatimonadetes bacterium]|nr:hypothetical protein [Gemmatimonadota bacterium]MYG84474.1 hypothetical protein [Gemmatimonadota bacterium]MYJ89907.1 hypothetical protein [Gemmatimonadota bacterium]
MAVMGQQAAGFTVVKIDPATGATSQATSPDPTANFPTGALRTRDGRIYVGAAYAGHLHCYDPKTEQLDDLGAINLPDDTFPCNMDEDENGVIWIGCYGSAGLTSYDPASGAFTRHGRMDETDMYCYPYVGAGGTVACNIRMTRPHVVVYDPVSGRRETVGPVVVTEDGGSLNLYRAADDQLYIRSTAGDFRLDGFEAKPVAALPDPAPPLTMSDGSTADFADREIQMFREMAITRPESGGTRILPVAYESAGSEIFLVHRGPDDNLYGSSILPLHLFRHDPSTGAMDDLGICTTATGEAYSMANMDGSLYICSYPGAVLSVYDPARPYHFGKDTGSNPRDLGRMDEFSYRPRSMVAGPLGRVWTASVPNYGMWGGPLSWYDPVADAFGTYRDIAGEASCWSLAWLEAHGLLAIGTTIDGGTGTQPRVDQASLFLWDYEKEEKVWEGRLPVEVTAVDALAVMDGGLLCGTARAGSGSILFDFDAGDWRFVHLASLPGGRSLEGGLQTGPDGGIYGFTTECFYRFDAAAGVVTTIHEAPSAFQNPGPMYGDGVYFTKKHELKKLVF